MNSQQGPCNCCLMAVVMYQCSDMHCDALHVAAGKGDFHPDSTPADLVFVVREELHPRYERRGNNLITRVNLPLVTALTGKARHRHSNQ